MNREKKYIRTVYKDDLRETKKKADITGERRRLRASE